MNSLRQDMVNPFFQESDRTFNTIEYIVDPDGEHRLFDILIFAGQEDFQVKYHLDEFDEIYKVVLSRLVKGKSNTGGLRVSEMETGRGFRKPYNNPIKGKPNTGGLRSTEMETGRGFRKPYHYSPTKGKPNTGGLRSTEMETGRGLRRSYYYDPTKKY